MRSPVASYAIFEGVLRLGAISDVVIAEVATKRGRTSWPWVLTARVIGWLAFVPLR